MSGPIGLEDPGFYAGDPDPVLAQIRGEPYSEGPGLTVLTRHSDVAALGRDPARFRSSAGVLLADRNREVAAADSILYLDPPAHTAHRQLVSRAFTPRTVAALEPFIRSLARELLGAMTPDQEVDLVDGLAAPLPILVMAELLGIPAGDRVDFRRWSDAVMAAASRLTDENMAQAAELFVYFDAQLSEREVSPRPDLLSALVAAEVNGAHLGRQEQLGFCMTLLVAGNETTRALISGGVLALADHPDQRAALAGRPDLIPAAVEEMLRWVTPIMAMGRTAGDGAEVAGRPVPVGEFLLLSYAAANRDPSVFGPDADCFRSDRSPNPHLAFGSGTHFCLGAGLARLEARIVFQELLAAWPEYRIAGPPERVPSTLLRQIGHLAVRLDGGGGR
jgi:cytochrome P450